MAKRCSACGFLNNPDNAHYCGKCGKNIATDGYWNLYDFRRYTPVERSKLEEYNRYEHEAKSSIWKKICKNVQKCCSDFWEEYGLGISFGIVFIIFMVLMFGIGYGIEKTIQYFGNN